jgi:hypothetical protein
MAAKIHTKLIREFFRFSIFQILQIRLANRPAECFDKGRPVALMVELADTLL